MNKLPVRQVQEREIMKYVVSIAIILLITGCVAIPPSKGIGEGNLAYDQGNYEKAKNLYMSGLKVATSQKWKPHIATSKYGLGRSYGQLCNFELAEKYLKEAAALERKISNGKGVHLSQDYFELARLYYGYNKYSEAVVYFKKAIPLVETLGIENSDPIGYADVLEDYAKALVKSGSPSEAPAIRDKISQIRKNNAGRSAGFKPVQFNKECSA